MKAILEFNLPEDQDEFRSYQNGPNALVALYDIRETLRRKIKYANEDISDETVAALIDIQDEFFRILTDNNVLEEV